MSFGSDGSFLRKSVSSKTARKCLSDARPAGMALNVSTPQQSESKLQKQLLCGSPAMEGYEITWWILLSKTAWLPEPSCELFQSN